MSTNKDKKVPSALAIGIARGGLRNQTIYAPARISCLYLGLSNYVAGNLRFSFYK
jgi:hypothetical protein